MDPLESKIQSLQDDLQSVEMPDRLAIWEGIVRRPAPPRPWWQRPWLWVAGSLLLLCSGAALGIWWNETRHERDEAAILAALPEPWQNRAREYRQMVSYQEVTVRNAAAQIPDLQADMQELQLLDSMHRDFLNDFHTLPKDEATAIHYLHYYEQKVRILELILKEIQLRKNESEKHIPQEI